MSGVSYKNVNLPWHQYDRYWMCIFCKAGALPESAQSALKQQGLSQQPSGAWALKAGRDWKPVWDKIFACLKHTGVVNSVLVAVTPGDIMTVSLSDAKTVAAINAIAESLWLGDAMLEGRLHCYLQPVVSDKDKVFGYESFVRAKTADGQVIAGDAVVAACRALNIEYSVDRLLHVQAIKTFVSSNFGGYLFVNFFPGFIQRPSVYLEGLSESATSYGMIAKHVVLEFTQSETPRDIAHMRNVCDYARSRGYSVAMDDMSSVEGARKLLPEIKPDFVKIDMKLVRRLNEPGVRETIKGIVELAHAARATVIGEGIETEEQFSQIKYLGADLFQGYYFSPPVPVEAALKRATGTA